MSLFNELKRRNVFRVGVAYVLMAWVVLQGADFALDLIDAPNWVIQALTIAAVAGLPIALVLAWAFELTPEGVKLERDVDRSQSITPQTGKKLDKVIILVLLLVIVFMAARLWLMDTVHQPPVQSEAPADTGAEAKSIAVLPFADLSQGGDQQWFADGLAEEILNSLARTPDLLVTSRTSSFRYRDSELDLTEIARELNVAHVLEGSVRQSGDRLRVTAQLIRASDGFHLWSQNYDRDQADMIAIQEDLAVQIARALETSMDPAALAEMARMGTDSVEAYRAYLRGRQLLQQGLTTANVENNIPQNFEAVNSALSYDPEFSAAHHLMAELWRAQLTPSWPGFGSMAATSQEALNHFHHAIGNAIRTANTDEDRLLYRAIQAFVDMRLRDASTAIRQYLEHRPNDFVAWRLFSDLVFVTHDPADLDLVLAYHRERSSVEPSAATEFANLSFLKTDLAEAVNVALDSLERWPGHPGLEYQVHRLLLWAGEVERARPLVARFPAGGTNRPLMQIRQACAEGRADEANAIFEEAVKDGQEDAMAAWLTLSILGRQEEAIQLFQPIVSNGIAYQLADLSGYPQFGSNSFPSLVVVYEREGLPLRPSRLAPFTCPLPEPPSIAVLPFVNMSSDPDREFFSDGISEEILNALTHIPNLKVAARTSSFQFKGQSLDVAEIGAQLGVQHLLEGSVRSAGSQVRVTAQLIQVSDGFHLWSRTWDRELNDIFAIQDEIAAAIAGALRETFTAEELPQSQSVDLVAYELYLKGRGYVAMRGEGNLDEGIRLLKEALRIEPGFADAMASLATAYSVLPYYSATAVAREVYDLGKQWAQKAIDIESGHVEALAVLGMLRYLADLDYETSEQLMLRALALGPANVTVHNFLGDLFLRTADFERALYHEDRALAYDPLSPVQWADRANVALLMGKYEEAVRYAERALELDPAFVVAVSVMLDAYQELGDDAGLQRLIGRIRQQDALQPASLTAAHLTQAIVRGEREQVPGLLQERLRELERGEDGIPRVSFDAAAAGDFDLAARLLEQALEQQIGMWQFPMRVRLPEQAPENAAWQAFWAKPGPARLVELRRRNGFTAQPLPPN